MYKLRHTLVSAIFIALCATALAASPTTPRIKAGKATLSINFEANSTTIPDKLQVAVMVPSLFDSPFECETMALPRDSNSFSADIMLDTEECLVGLIVGTDDQRYSVGMVELSQNKSLIMNGTFNPDGTVTYQMSDTDGFNGSPLDASPDNQGLILSDILMRFAAYRPGDSENEPVISASDFKSWQQAKLKLDTLYTVQREYALNGRPIPPAASQWLDNNLRYFYAGNWMLNYVARAKRNWNTIVETPPLEYFAFLNEIDYGPEILHLTPVFGPYHFLTKILTELPVGIEPIGETDVFEWKANTTEKLSTVIDNPTALLVDLLAATSYVMQLNDDNRPFSATQKENITKGFDNDLSSILFSRNDRLTRQLRLKANLHDMSESGIESVQKYIDTNYPDRPVVIDFWNTWCSPCMQAHRDLESIRQDPKFDKVVFLYISDTSSSPDEWQITATRIGGEHLRIPQTCMEKLLKEYSLTAFPSYLFFDNNHTLRHTSTAFPGADAYGKLLTDIISESPEK